MYNFCNYINKFIYKSKLSLYITCAISISMFNISQIKTINEVIKKDMKLKVNNLLFNYSKSISFLSTLNDDENNENSIYRICAHSGSADLVPLSPKKIDFNGEKDQENPFDDTGIEKIGLYNNDLLVQTKKDLGKLYLANISNPSNIKVYSLDDIKDALGNKTPSILNFTSTNLGSENTTSTTYAFAAVTNEKGKFDGNGSGIAICQFYTKKEEIKEEKKEEEQTNTDNQEPKYKVVDQGLKQVSILNSKPLTYGLSINSNFLKIGKSLQSIDPKVDLHWDPMLNVLFIALSVTSDGQDSGARALCVAYFDRGRIVYGPIAPANIFTNDRQIVGAKGNNKPASIDLSKVRTMHTSTNLSYIVVLGGNKNIINTKRRIFSLPIVSRLRSDNNNKAQDVKAVRNLRLKKDNRGEWSGCLADVNELPHALFSRSEPYRYLRTDFVEPALKPESLYTVDSPEAQVGGPSEAPGDITDMHISGDTVYISIEEGENKGIYYSQALFDHLGMIVRWTKWQRAMGVTDSVKNFAINFKLGTTSYINSSEGNLLFTSSWSNGKNNIEDLVSKEYKGASSAFSLKYKVNNTKDNSAITLLTSKDKAIILELDKDNSSLLKDESFEPIVFNAEIGLIKSACIVSNDNYNWLIVSGTKKIAILSNEDGTGWLNDRPLDKETLSRMSFKIHDNLPIKSSILKVTNYSNRLFILTGNELIELNINDIINDIKSEFSDVKDNENNINYIKYAQANKILKNKRNNLFTDVIVGKDIIILGTNNGLFINTNINNSSWKQIELQESVGSLYGINPVAKLYSYTQTGYENDISDHGNLHVINGYAGRDQQFVYRFYVNKNKIKKLPDFYIFNRPSFFIDLGAYYSSMLYDGAQLFASKNKSEFVKFTHNGEQMEPGFTNTELHIFRSNIQSGQREVFNQSISPVLDVESYNKINSIIRTHATGSTVLAGDFGIRINN